MMTGLDIDVDARLVRLAHDVDVGVRGAGVELAVLADVVRALRGALQVRDLAQ